MFCFFSVEMNILQWVVVILAVFGLSRGNSISAQCGRKTVLADSIRNVTEENHWPWLAAIVSRDDGRLLCVATLIAMRSVVTTANCMVDSLTSKNLSPSDFDVRLGVNNLSADDKERKVLTKLLEPIIKIVIHPDWNRTGFRYEADIALVIAGKYIEFSEFISPICLPNRDIENVLETDVSWEFAIDAGENIWQVTVKKFPRRDCILTVASPCRKDSGNRHT